jgi:hypothetical protein
MAGKDQNYDEITEEPIPPDIDIQPSALDTSGPDVNLPTTAEAEQMVVDPADTSKRNKRKIITEDEPDNVTPKQSSPIAKRKKNLSPDNNNNDHDLKQQPPKLPINYTLNSTGEGKIIIIKPQDNDIFKYPSKFSTAFEKTLFGKAKVKDIRINRLKGIIVVEMHSTDEIIKYNLTSVNQIGQWMVQCYRPLSEYSKTGVIAPIDISEDIMEIKDQIQIEGNGKVMRVERLMKNTKEGKIPSTAVKITFECTDMPKHLKINHFFYSVRPYVQNPVQCFRCQRLGHTAGACKASKPRCLVCAKDHLVGNCIPNNPNLQCANCNGNHKANSRECYIIKQAYEIEKRRAAGESYSEARINVENRTPRRNEMYNTVSTSAEVHHSLNSQIERPISYSEATKINNKSNTYQSRIPISGQQDRQKDYNIMFRGSENTCRKCKQIETKEMETQTEQYTDEQKEKNGLIKLRNCLTEVLSSNIWKECNDNRKKIIECAMRNAFGIDLTKQDEKENPFELETEESNSTENDIVIEKGVLSSGDELSEGNKKKQTNIERDKISKNINKTTNIKSKNQARTFENINGSKNSYVKTRNNKISGFNSISKEIIKRKDQKYQNKS